MLADPDSRFAKAVELETAAPPLLDDWFNKTSSTLSQR